MASLSLVLQYWIDFSNHLPPPKSKRERNTIQSDLRSTNTAWGHWKYQAITRAVVYGDSLTGYIVVWSKLFGIQGLDRIVYNFDFKMDAATRFSRHYRNFRHIGCLDWLIFCRFIIARWSWRCFWTCLVRIILLLVSFFAFRLSSSSDRT